MVKYISKTTSYDQYIARCSYFSHCDMNCVLVTMCSPWMIMLGHNVESNAFWPMFLQIWGFKCIYTVTFDLHSHSHILFPICILFLFTYETQHPTTNNLQIL